MCTNFSTRNRAVLFNNYTVQTILVNRDAYCPCGPNTQDYTVRSRLYNPDPKYACHSDLTCHQFDSIPKDKSCGGYGAPQFNCCGGGPPATTIPCVSPGGGCYPDGDNTDCPQPPPKPCERRRIRFPDCCKIPSTYKDLIEDMQRCPQPSPCCPFPCPQPCCPFPCPQQPQDDEENCDEDREEQDAEPQSCYSLIVPPEMGDCCGSKVTFNFGGPNGITRSVKTQGGCNQVCMPCQDDCVMLEAYGGPGGCGIGNGCMRIQSRATPLSYCVQAPPCLPAQEQQQPQLQCCYLPEPQVISPRLSCCRPPPCRNRRKVRCSPYMTLPNACSSQGIECRPPFRKY